MSECSDLDRSHEAPHPSKYPNLNSLSWVKNQPDAPKFYPIAPGRSNADDYDDLSDQDYEVPCMKQEKAIEDFNTDLLSLDYAAYGTKSQYKKTTEAKDIGRWKPDNYGQSRPSELEELRDLDFRWDNPGTGVEKHISVEEREKSKIKSEESSIVEELYDPEEDELPPGGQLLERDLNWQTSFGHDKVETDLDYTDPREFTRLNKTAEVKKLNVVSDREAGRELNEKDRMRKMLEENLMKEHNILSAESVVVPQKQLIKNEPKAYEEYKQVKDDYMSRDDKTFSHFGSRLDSKKYNAQSQMDTGFSQISLDYNSTALSKVERKPSVSRIEEAIASEKSTPVEILNSHSKLSTEGN